MGILDWLFGRNKNEYGTLNKQSSVKKQSRRAYSDTSQSPPASSTASGPTSRFQNEGFTSPNRFYGTFFRRLRNKHQQGPVIRTFFKNWEPEFQWQAVFGGTQDNPSRGGDAAKITNHGLPELESMDDLCKLLSIESNTLARFVLRDGDARSKRDRMYRADWVTKKSGGKRLLCRPVNELKQIQRTLLGKLIRDLPLQDSVHGFRKNHDVMTSAALHVGRDIVIGMDIANFFPTLTFKRVSGYFQSLGYSRGISIALANLTTFRPFDLREVEYSNETRHPQLPQGAPTSPGIANAICWRMDKRLSALAKKFGGDYTRYADDLTFSGFDDMAQNAGRLLRLVRKIIETEGFVLNENKTRIMRKGSQQRVTGVVVNQKTNLPRREFDKLKAILHNCIKHGPASQNRDNIENYQEHLRGRVAHAQHIGPARGQKLKALFDQIAF